MKSKLLYMALFLLSITSVFVPALACAQAPSVIYAVTAHLQEGEWVYNTILQQADYPAVGQPTLIAEAESHQWSAGFPLIQAVGTGNLYGHVQATIHGYSGLIETVQDIALTYQHYGGWPIFISSIDDTASVEAYVLGDPGTPYRFDINVTAVIPNNDTGINGVAIGWTNPGWDFYEAPQNWSSTIYGNTDSTTVVYNGKTYSHAKPYTTFNVGTSFGDTGPNQAPFTVSTQAVVTTKIKVQSLASAFITGNVTLEAISPNAPAQNITFVCRPSDGSGDITTVVPVSPNGNFSIAGLPLKKYTLHIKGDQWLAQNVSVDATNGDVYGVTATLLAGDANNDNSVDSTDFGVLIGAFGGDSSVPGSGYDVTADFNCDGFVDSTDFGLLIGNFNSAGDN